MNKEYSEEDYKNIAKQLSNPEGEHGVKTGISMNTSNVGMTNSAVDLLDLQDEEKVLEIGHGNGGHIFNLLEKAKSLKYYGADISETIIKEATKINKIFIENNQVDFQLTDGVSLPFTQEKFNKIFTVNTIYFWINPISYLTEIKRVLKPNGTFVISFADKTFMEKLPFTKYGFNLYELESVIALLEKSAFRNIKSYQKTEQINSNAGFMVERNYFVISAIC